MRKPPADISRCLPGVITTYEEEYRRYIVPDPVTIRDQLLEERQKTHGDFGANARISQHLKAVFECDGCYENLIPIHREALDMIALKLSRILSGQANFKDHWDDIAGYAKLGSEACE